MRPAPPGPGSVTLDEVLRPKRERRLRRLPGLIVEAFRLVWRASPRQLLTAGALQVTAGLSLAAQLLVMRRMLAQVADGDSVDLAQLAPELVVLAVLLLIVAVATLAQREQQALLAQAVEKYTTGHVLAVSTSVELIRYDHPAFYDRLQRARVNANVRPLQIANGVIGLMGSGAALLAVGGTLLFLEPLVVLLIVLGGLPALYTNRRSSELMHAHAVRQTQPARRRAYLYQTLTRKEEAQEIRAFDSSEHLREEHDRLYDEQLADLRWTLRRRFYYGSVNAVVASLVTVGSLVMLLGFVQIGRLDVGSAAVAVGAVIIVAGRIRTFIASTGSLYEGSLFLADFTDFVEAERGDVEQGEVAPGQLAQADPPPAAAADAVENGHGAAASPPAGFEQIRLEQVGFTYPSRSEPSLTDVSLSIRRGEVVALVGENGSGKTTLTKLLAGLYRPTVGTVWWNGVDAAQMDLAVLRDHVTVIFQDFARYFLHAHENIAISRIARIADREGVVRAAEMAGAAGFLSGLPAGFDTLLGPAFVGGSDLSTGQWQRVALARAYFRNAPMLILDEPTAALDPRGEYEIFQQVRRLAEGHAVVLVSHRFSSVRAADRILVLDGGRIVEEGSHDALMAHGGVYADLFSMQAEGYRSST